MQKHDLKPLMQLIGVLIKFLFKFLQDKKKQHV